MYKLKIGNTNRDINRSTRIILLVSVIISGVAAFLLGGAEYLIVLILGILVYLGKDFIFWKGSGDRGPFRAYVFGDKPRSSAPWRSKSDDRNHRTRHVSKLFARLHNRRR